MTRLYGGVRVIPRLLHAARCTLHALPVVATLAGPTAAQPARRELVGVVRDAAGKAIDGANVQIPGAAARTDERGAFQLWTGEIDTVTISIRRLGYAAVSALIAARNGQWDTVMVEMEQNSQHLAAVTVTGSRVRRSLGLRDFEERRAKRSGVFVTRDEIAAHNTTRVSDVLRGRRGLTFVRLRSGYGVRFALHTGKRSNCTPDVWLDGQRVKGLEVDELLPQDIEAMELYESISGLPFEFTPPDASIPCGTIVIWTRIPGR
jgi:CarboxypepD_reg-like domain